VFRLRTDAKDWFKEISSIFPVDFDIYYFCLMAGIAGRHKADVAHAEAKDLVDHFPREYQTQSRILVALFLKTEVDMAGVNVTDKEAVRATIRRFVSTRSSTHLSNAGVDEMNRFSFGGFDLLTEWFEERPRHIETFLPMYKKYLDKELARRASE
jgi:hypothetical protein